MQNAPDIKSSLYNISQKRAKIKKTRESRENFPAEDI